MAKNCSHLLTWMLRVRAHTGPPESCSRGAEEEVGWPACELASESPAVSPRSGWLPSLTSQAHSPGLPIWGPVLISLAPVFVSQDTRKNPPLRLADQPPPITPLLAWAPLGAQGRRGHIGHEGPYPLSVPSVCTWICSTVLAGSKLLLRKASLPWPLRQRPPGFTPEATRNLLDAASVFLTTTQRVCPPFYR